MSASRSPALSAWPPGRGGWRRAGGPTTRRTATTGTSSSPTARSTASTATERPAPGSPTGFMTRFAEAPAREREHAKNQALGRGLAPRRSPRSRRLPELRPRALLVPPACDISSQRAKSPREEEARAAGARASEGSGQRSSPFGRAASRWRSQIPNERKRRYDPASLSASPARPYLALRHRDYRRLAISQFVSIVGSQMQVVAINWHIYLLTRSPLALGFVGLTRVVPIVMLSLWGGVLADRLDRRRLMTVTQLAMTTVALALAGVTFAHRETLWLLYALNFFSASAVAFDGPARQALIPRLVPPEDLPGALSLNLSVFQAGLIGGPALAGLIIAGHSGPLHVPAARFPSAGAPTSTEALALIYLLNALSFLAVIFALVTMKTSGAPEKGA